jgi:heavy metal translocating P-type ATPase
MMSALQQPHDYEPADAFVHTVYPNRQSPDPQKEITVSWKERIKSFLLAYPIPISTIVLMLLSLIFRLLGIEGIDHWFLIAVILIGGIPLLWETLSQIWQREFGVDLIAIIAIFGALLQGEYLAGSVVVLMLSGGEALESFALARARGSLSSLAERAPRIAHLWQGDALVDILAEEVNPNMVIIVKPGELIPVDGIIQKGESSISEADLTGEPVPVMKTPGTTVMSGSVNLDGVIEIRALRRAAESKYAQILRLVEEAQQNKAPIHRLADRYAMFFTIASISLAVIAWILTGQSINALAVMVVATPCPLILATPIAIMSGIGSAARNGVIVKSGAAIEQFGEVDTAVFDKTGTLTLGTPEMTDLILGEDAIYDADTLLTFAASVEQVSSHILARSVVTAAHNRHLDLVPVEEFTEVLGKGVSGHLVLYKGEPKHVVSIGNGVFMEQLGIEVPPSISDEHAQRTLQGDLVSYLAVDGKIQGLVIIADVPRPEIAQLIANLKKSGIRHTVLLTGDNEVVAQKIGNTAQVDRVVSRCLPDDKVRVIQELLDQKHRVLMVGDGVNDAPALATATVGMAIGAQGLTAASAAADAVLLSDDINRVAISIRIGRWVMLVARQGIWIGMALSGIAMLVAAFGYLPPTAGALLQEGIDVIVIINALRAGNILKFGGLKDVASV